MIMVERKSVKESGKRLAVVLVRGRVDMKTEILSTLDMLRLKKKNCCVVLDFTPSILGMVKKVRNFVTYGFVDSETFALLEEKRGGKKFYSLNPPKKGFGRKGIKVPFSLGGALGDRKDKINDLIRRMV